MNRYKLKVGRHSDEFGKDYMAGDVIETHHELDKLFGPLKFEFLGNVPLKRDALESDEETEGEEESSEKALPTRYPVKGSDVTDQFPKAKPNGVVVIRNKLGFHLLDGQEEFLSITDEPLSLKKEVNQFLRQL